MPPTAPASSACAGCRVLRFDLARHRIGVSVVVPGAVDTPLVQSVDIAGVDREHPKVQRLVRLFSGHAVSAEKVARKILAEVARNRFLIYTSPDIWALYMFKRVAWRPYSAVMSRVNVLFTGALRPHGAQYVHPARPAMRRWRTEVRSPLIPRPWRPDFPPRVCGFLHRRGESRGKPHSRGMRGGPRVRPERGIEAAATSRGRVLRHVS